MKGAPRECGTEPSRPNVRIVTRAYGGGEFLVSPEVHTH